MKRRKFRRQNLLSFHFLLHVSNVLFVNNRHRHMLIKNKKKLVSTNRDCLCVGSVCFELTKYSFFEEKKFADSF